MQSRQYYHLQNCITIAGNTKVKNRMNGKKSSRPDPRIAFFDRHAANWDAEGPCTETVQARFEELDDLLGLAAGQELLQVGCGTGRLTGHLVRKVAPGSVTAVDFSRRMLQEASRKDIDAEFRRADVCCDDLGEGRYDVIFCFHSFPHLRDQRAALRNLGRSLKPLGRLIVMHLAGSKHINEFHTGVGGAVAGDHLPPGDAWDELLAQAHLKRDEFIDRDDLFLLKASKVSRLD